MPVHGHRHARTHGVANLRAEQRLASEWLGQSVGAFEADLMGRELQTRRDQISEALAMGAGLISEEQRMQLQVQLSLIDQAIQQSQFEQRLSRITPVKFGSRYTCNRPSSTRHVLSPVCSSL